MNRKIKFFSPALAFAKRLIRCGSRQEEKQTRQIDRIHKSLELEIKAHIEAEAQLKESEKKYRHLVSSLPEGVLIVQDDRIVFSNSTIQRMTGYEQTSLQGMVFSNLFSSEKQVLKPPGNRSVKVLTRKDGSNIYVEKSCVMIMFHQKRAHLYSIHDVTQKVMADREKKALEEELAKARKMQAIGLLAGGVAHDLNNVLAGLVSTPDILLADLPEDSRLRPHIEMIKDSGKRAAVIVDDLLTLARGRKKSLEPVHFNHVIEDYLKSPELDQLQKDYDKICIEKSLDPRVCFIEGSGIQIRKLVMNLVSNAIEAVGNQAGSVVIKTRWLETGWLPAQYQSRIQSRNCLKFSVSDTGEGIKPRDIEHIFEPFYSRKIAGRSGTGLGLSIVWNAVHEHKGYIDVQSENGKTRFETYFPAEPARGQLQNTQGTVLTLDDLKGNGEKILIIEDMEAQRKITRNMVRRLGYETVTAESGEDAVRIVQKEKIDLVVLDMILEKGMNGLETYQQLLLIDSQLKAIISSGYAITNDVKLSQKLGAGPYVKKPFTLEQIGLAIKNELAS